jgi:hypothetical protein
VAPSGGWAAYLRNLAAALLDRPPAADGSAGPAAADGSAGLAAADGSAGLAAALRRLAAGGPSEAIREQVAELLPAGAPPAGRDRLVRAAIKFRDQLGDGHPELRAVLLDGLASAGVREVLADGETLDGMRHDVFAVEPAPGPEWHDRVARTVRCGYADVDRVLRVPSVVVYVHEPADDPR